jgi:hypothetical protein
VGSGALCCAAERLGGSWTWSPGSGGARRGPATDGFHDVPLWTGDMTILHGRADSADAILDVELGGHASLPRRRIGRSSALHKRRWTTRGSGTRPSWRQHGPAQEARSVAAAGRSANAFTRMGSRREAARGRTTPMHPHRQLRPCPHCPRFCEGGCDGCDRTAGLTGARDARAPRCRDARLAAAPLRSRKACDPKGDPTRPSDGISEGRCRWREPSRPSCGTGISLRRLDFLTFADSCAAPDTDQHPVSPVTAQVLGARCR